MSILFSKICDFIKEAPPPSGITPGKHISPPHLEFTSWPRAFFDGAEQKGICGCGFVLMTNPGCTFYVHWNGGRGTNMMAEAMALGGLLSMCLFLDLHDVKIYGDSQMLVNFVSQKINITQTHLAGWLERIRFLWNALKGTSINHIYRELNQEADGLSKKGLKEDPDFWHLQIQTDGIATNIQDFSPSLHLVFP